MKKSNRLLSLAILSLLVVCFTAIGAIFSMADTQTSGNLTPWGDAESGDYVDYSGRTMTAVTTEKFSGEKSFELAATTQVRITSPSVDGTIYKGTLKVKGAADDTTFQVKDTAVNQLVDNSYGYSYLAWDTITVGTEWTDYSFSLCFRYDADETALYASKDGKNEQKIENIKAPLAGYELIFAVSGKVYVDDFSLDVYVPETNDNTVNLTPWGNAENGNFGTLTAVNTEKFAGENSFKVTNSVGDIRISSPSLDGMLYKGNLKVKGAAADTEFQLIYIATSQTASGWDWAYLYGEKIVVGTEWTDYSFNMAYRYDAETKSLYYSYDGKNESKQENITGPMAGFDLRFAVSADVYVDDLAIVSAGIPEKPLQLPNYTVGDTVLSWDFEESIQGWYGEGGSVTRNTSEETGVANSGNYAVKTTGVWTRQMNTSEAVSWLTEGYFFEASMYARKEGAGSAKATSEMFVWGADPDGDGWQMCNTRIVVIPATELTNEYTQIKSIFGVYSDGTNSYAYHAKGKTIALEKLPLDTGKLITYQYALDIGEANGLSMWADDIVIKKAVVNKDAVLTIEGYENVTLTVSQNGTELATQPTIVNEGNVYTIKDLVFEKFSTTYSITVKSNGETVKTVEVDFVNSEKNVGQAYEATLTVANENGESLTNATVTVNGQEITANTNGVYTVADLDSDVVAVVSCEGYIDKKVAITALNKEVSVVMLTVKDEIVVEGNIMNGNMESGFGYPNYNSRAIEYEVSTEDRYDGSHSLKLTATAANAVHNVRMDTTGSTNGTAYYFELMVKGVNGGSMTIGVGLTGQNTAGGWVTAYLAGEAVELTGEWQKLSVTYAFRFDELAKSVYASVNGAEEALSSYEFASIAALDLNIFLTEGAVAYVDNIVVLETYDATVTVNDENGTAVANATFEVVDFSGNTATVVPAYNNENGTYLFENLKGVVKIIASIGEKTYAPVTVSKALSTVVIEESYDITLTLKDQNGDVVIGAKVVARKGITNVGDFVDNGDGTYTLEGAMGQNTLIITIEGYSFEKVNVSISNATLTVTGEKEGGDNAPSDSSPSKSCGGYMGTSLCSVIALMGIALLAKKKN